MKWLFIITQLLVNSPFYPHWLDVKNQRKGEDELIKKFTGKVLETGCGNGEKKYRAYAANKKITEYIATDYDDWDEDFAHQAKVIKSLGIVTQLLYGKAKERKNIDVVCSALDLPFKNNSFDTYCSFTVLEHIVDPATFFTEAHRILKKGGGCYITMPFLYRDHGSGGKDFQRFTKAGLENIAKESGFKVEFIKTYCFFGTTIASMINQYIIRKIMESNLVIKIILFPLSPIIFLITNSLGYLLDLFDHDDRFATTYCVALRKV